MKNITNTNATIMPLRLTLDTHLCKRTDCPCTCSMYVILELIIFQDLAVLLAYMHGVAPLEHTIIAIGIV